MTMTRRTMIAGAGTALPLVNIRRARAAQFSLKLGHAQTVTHPLNVRTQEAAAAIRKSSDGQLDMRVFPNSQLGSELDMLAQVRSGSLDMVATSILFLEPVVPDVNLSGLGYAFRNTAQVWQAWDNAFGDDIRKQIAAAGNITVFDKTFDNGFRQVTSSVRPIKGPEDLHGLKIRVPSIRVQQSIFTHLGAAPTTVNIKEAYSALQTHIADAEENALTSIDLFKFYEVQKYCSMTNHMWDGFWIMSSSASLATLPDALRHLVTTTFDDAALKQRADMAALTTKLRGQLEAHGLVFNEPEFQPFRDALKASGFYAEWRGRASPAVWSLLEKTTGPLT